MDYAETPGLYFCRPGREIVNIKHDMQNELSPYSCDSCNCSIVDCEYNQSSRVRSFRSNFFGSCDY